MFWASTIKAAILSRIQGPGGLYNAGNLLGLSVSLAVAALEAPDGHDLTTTSKALFSALAGSPAALALTIATLIFLWSGEHYHRAWRPGFPPDPEKTRAGDISSGVGAVALAVGLVLLAQPILAASSGVLHAAGKFGSAFDPRGECRIARRPIASDDLYRAMVVASRVPAIVNMLAQLVGIAIAEVEASREQTLLLVTMLGCYGLWTAADLLLMRGAWSKVLAALRLRANRSGVTKQRDSAVT